MLDKTLAAMAASVVETAVENYSALCVPIKPCGSHNSIKINIKKGKIGATCETLNDNKA